MKTIYKLKTRNLEFSTSKCSSNLLSCAKMKRNVSGRREDRIESCPKERRTRRGILKIVTRCRLLRSLTTGREWEGQWGGREKEEEEESGGEGGADARVTNFGKFYPCILWSGADAAKSISSVSKNFFRPLEISKPDASLKIDKRLCFKRRKSLRGNNYLIN